MTKYTVRDWISYNAVAIIYLGLPILMFGVWNLYTWHALYKERKLIRRYKQWRAGSGGETIEHC